jgi:hypothetical protein
MVADETRYPTHAFVVMTLQKLVHKYEPDSDDDSDDDYASDAETASKASTRKGNGRSFVKRVQRLFRSKRDTSDTNLEPGYGGGFEKNVRSQPTGFSDAPEVNELRTLQRYHATPNDPRTVFMEKHSALSGRKLAVACEQVAIFITQDNTIISFFESSAQEVAAPIIRRLGTSDTIIRQ